MNLSNIELEQQGPVLIAYLNRPKSANALNGALWLELHQLALWVSETAEVRVLVLASKGRHFCAGIDFSLVNEIRQAFVARADGNRQEWLRAKIQELQAAFTALEQCPKPIVSAIDGACIGGGIDLITSCDIRYATHRSSFCVKEIDLGIVADVGTIQRLPSLVGEGVARELAFTAREVDAHEAHRIGLLNQVFESRDALMDAALQLAQNIASKSPLAIRNTKRAFNHARDHSVADGLNFVATLNAGILFSADAQEAMMAAMQKRPAKFKD